CAPGASSACAGWPLPVDRHRLTLNLDLGAGVEPLDPARPRLVALRFEELRAHLVAHLGEALGISGHALHGLDHVDATRRADGIWAGPPRGAQRAEEHGPGKRVLVLGRLRP